MTDVGIDVSCYFVDLRENQRFLVNFCTEKEFKKKMFFNKIINFALKTPQTTPAIGVSRNN